MRWLGERVREVRCLVFHWERQRSSYSNRCTTCGLDW